MMQRFNLAVYDMCIYKNAPCQKLFSAGWAGWVEEAVGCPVQWCFGPVFGLHGEEAECWSLALLAAAESSEASVEAKNPVTESERK